MVTTSAKDDPQSQGQLKQEDILDQIKAENEEQKMQTLNFLNTAIEQLGAKLEEKLE